MTATDNILKEMEKIRKDGEKEKKSPEEKKPKTNSGDHITARTLFHRAGMD